MPAKSIIRTIYLYLFALVGLFVLIFGFIGLIRLALTTWVFPEAGNFYYEKAVPLPVGKEGADLVADLENCEENCDLSEQDKETLSQWLADYRAQGEIDNEKQIRSDRQRQLANYLAMIIVGFPVYFYHWLIIKRETKRSNSNNN